MSGPRIVLLGARFVLACNSTVVDPGSGGSGAATTSIYAYNQAGASSCCP
jgi:hypothetical protein